MKILVSKFSPFDGERINPSIEAVKKLPDTVEGAEIIKVEIPVSGEKSIEMLEKYIEIHRPDAVINVGQAGGRSDITVERIGINLDDYRIEDNDGNKITDKKIAEDGDDGYFTTIPVKAIVSAVRKKGIPASVSYSAGTYICNHVCYYMAYLSRKKYPEMRTGFIHIPYLPEQTVDKKGEPSMSSDLVAEALKTAIEAVILNKKDISFSEGCEC